MSRKRETISVSKTITLQREEFRDMLIKMGYRICSHATIRMVVQDAELTCPEFLHISWSEKEPLKEVAEGGSDG